MSKSKSDGSHILPTMREHAEAGNGEIYRWLKKNRRKVRAGFKSTGSGWNGVVASITKDGVTGRNGQAPNSCSVRRVWTRLCADLEVAAKARAAVQTKKAVSHRSQQNPSWQPPITNAPRTVPAILPRREHEQQLLPRPQSPTPPSQAPPRTTKSALPENTSAEVRAKLERLKQQLLEDDYKKFGRP